MVDTLREQMLEDVSGVILNEDDFAERITYYPIGSGPKVINAVVLREEDFALFVVDDGTQKTRRMHVWISTMPGDGIEFVNHGDEVMTQDDDDKWKVIERPVRDGHGMQQLTISRIEPFEKSGQNFRRPFNR